MSRDSEYIESEFQKRMRDIVNNQSDEARAHREAQVVDESFERLQQMLGSGDGDPGRIPVSLSILEKNSLYHEILHMLRQGVSNEEIAKNAVMYIDGKLKTAVSAMEEGTEGGTGGSGPTRGRGSPIFRRSQ